MRRNVELKARLGDPEQAQSRLLELGAVDAGVLDQRDTYFAVPHGHLKLREEPGRPALLIRYRRADTTAPRVSEYDLVAVPEPAALVAVLERALDLRGVVTKRRRLFLWERTVRVHVDEVDGLGWFVEIEAVAAAESDLEREDVQVRRLREALALADADLVAAGYADLLLG